MEEAPNCNTAENPLSRIIVEEVVPSKQQNIKRVDKLKVMHYNQTNSLMFLDENTKCYFMISSGKWYDKDGYLLEERTACLDCSDVSAKSLCVSCCNKREEITVLNAKIPRTPTKVRF